MRARWLLLLALVAGCDDASMSHQPKVPAYRSAKAGPGPVPAETVMWREGPVAVPPLSLALLERGQRDYRHFCVPCHSETGDGNGMVVQRGFARPPAFSTAPVREATDARLFDVITNGYGSMYGFAARVAPGERWAIVAYLRALQRTSGTVADLPADAVAQLGEAPR